MKLANANLLSLWSKMVTQLSLSVSWQD